MVKNHEKASENDAQSSDQNLVRSIKMDGKNRTNNDGNTQIAPKNKIAVLLRNKLEKPKLKIPMLSCKRRCIFYCHAKGSISCINLQFMRGTLCRQLSTSTFAAQQSSQSFTFIRKADRYSDSILGLRRSICLGIESNASKARNYTRSLEETSLIQKSISNHRRIQEALNYGKLFHKAHKIKMCKIKLNQTYVGCSFILINEI